jgi:tripartite ATP-independent transporter DctM subunit
MGLILILAFFVLVAFGIPIGYVLGIVAVGGAYFFWDPAYLLVLARKMVSGCDSFTIMAMPLFMLSGALMNKSGITDSLVDFSKILVGHIRGGLAHVTIVASTLFAGLTGVAMADVAAIGSILIPAMEKDGYPKPFAAAVVTSAAVIGPIIPPSLVMLIYAHIMGESVAALFLGGIVPGLIMAIGLMVYTYYIAKNRNYPKFRERPTVGELGMSFFKSLPALAAPMVILGGIVLGFATPTEAAALVVLYAFILGFFVTRKIKLADLAPMLLQSMVVTAVVFLIIGTASQVGFLITDVHLPQSLANYFISLTKNKYLMLMLINAFLLLMGMILEIIPNVVLLSPILAPLALKLGVDPTHFALILLINLNIGMNTPPMGGLMFITSAMAGAKFEDVLKESWGYLLTQLATLLVITYIPDTVLWIPRAFGFVK